MFLQIHNTCEKTIVHNKKQISLIFPYKKTADGFWKHGIKSNKCWYRV